jgi:citrate synthase
MCQRNLCADHELTASTFAARIAASTDSDLYACFQTALGVLSGPKHGTTFIKLEKAVEALAKDRFLDDDLDGALDESFRHTLYSNGDPRARLLFERMSYHQISNAYTQKVLAKLQKRTSQHGGHPTIDLLLIIAANAMGLPRGAAAAIFMLGRFAGLVAHILEQKASGFMVRPRAKYVGR